MDPIQRVPMPVHTHSIRIGNSSGSSRPQSDQIRQRGNLLKKVWLRAELINFNFLCYQTAFYGPKVVGGTNERVPYPASTAACPALPCPALRAAGGAIGAREEGKGCRGRRARAAPVGTSTDQIPSFV